MEDKFFARNGQRYVQVSPGARYESELQILVERNIPALFPDYVGKRMEPLLSTPAGDVKPDLVMVRIDGRGWGLVEVEIEGHSFSSHVLPQLTKLTFAESFPKLAEALSEAGLPLQAPLIRSALSFKPAVFLALQGSSLGHAAHLTKLGVEVRDFDVLQAPDKPNEYILAVSDRTVRRRQIQADAIRSPTAITRNIWKIADPTTWALVSDENTVDVELLGTRALWTVTMESDGLLLRQPAGLSSPKADLDSIVQACVLVDDEHSVMYLEPTEGAA